MEVASLIFKSLTKNESQIDEFEKAFKCKPNEDFERILRVAALIHDIGHSPFSHGPEEVFPFDNSIRKKHEDYTGEILKETGLSDLIDEEFKSLKYDYELITKISIGGTKISNEDAIDRFLSNIITG